MFGVDRPSEEITVQMRDLLQAKLADITLRLLGSMLQRNPNLHMNPRGFFLIYTNILFNFDFIVLNIFFKRCCIFTRFKQC